MAPSGSTDVTTAFCMTSQMCMPRTITLLASDRKPAGHVEAAIGRKRDLCELLGVDHAEVLEAMTGRRGTQLLLQRCGIC